jgi:hypothetical protein
LPSASATRMVVRLPVTRRRRRRHGRCAPGLSLCLEPISESATVGDCEIGSSSPAFELCAAQIATRPGRTPAPAAPR